VLEDERAVKWGFYSYQFAVVPKALIVLKRLVRSIPWRNELSPRSKTAAVKASKTADVVIPDRLYFRIGEVSRLCRLPAYVLRFWETEFSQLKPTKSSTGQRMYRRKDVENVLHIKKLLYEEGFTIAGARQQLREEIKSDKKQSPLPFPAASAPNLKYIRQGLKDILTLLSARA
jgi:DNA-binding transcriptional MerR regulator